MLTHNRWLSEKQFRVRWEVSAKVVAAPARSQDQRMQTKDEDREAGRTMTEAFPWPRGSHCCGAQSSDVCSVDESALAASARP